MTSKACVQADLYSYFAKPEPAYRWEKRSESSVVGGKIVELHLVSQTWQGIDWEHKLEIYFPENVKTPHFCALLNTGGNGGSVEKQIGMTLATSMECPFAILYNIPNQPLYGGKTEDDLIVHTWQKYLETGDESWPLHFPMAKAVLKAIDTLQAYAKDSQLPELSEFLIAGASKRGWTAWLAGASRDKRIKAIVPMVIDTLNLPAQMKHQQEVYQGFSEQIEAYTKAGIMSALSTERGKRLLELEDPYSYRNLLTLPKLLLLGTNDRYWTQDALNLYWDDLKGKKSVMYAPNSGHGLEDRGRLFNTISAFARSIASHSPFPKLTWNFSSKNDVWSIKTRSDTLPVSARLFRANSKTQDFRDSKWTSEELACRMNRIEATFRPPENGYSANFLEVTFEKDGKSYTLSTQIQVLKSL